MNNRYLLFSGYDYYPQGGWDDFIAASNELDYIKGLAREYAKSEYQWWHIVDTETMEKIDT